MKTKAQKVFAFYKLHPKRFWVIGIVIIAVVLYMVFNKPASTLTELTVSHSDLKQTVLATGQVTSSTDLALSFPTSGIVASLPVSVGDKVYAGETLATLDNRNEYAALKNAQANYQKVLAGSSSEEVAVAAAALDSAKANLVNIQTTQDTLVSNAYNQLLNVDLTPTNSDGLSDSYVAKPTITGAYTGDKEGSYTISTYGASGGAYFSFGGLETGSGKMSSTEPIALGTKGLFIQFPANFSSKVDTTWTISLPNKKSSLYLSVYNAYQNALKTHDSAISSAQDAVTEAQANLDLKKASARPADLAAAQAQVDAAKALYDNTVLVAPAGGTVVHVDVKIGERADAAKEVLVIQDVSNLYVEANINETSIARVALGQSATMTLDAFGPSTKFTGNVIHIDPSSTTEGSVVNFVVKTSIESPDKQYVIRPGMNANIVITAWDHPNVIAIPRAAITSESDGSESVKVALDDKNDKLETRKITTGQTGDGSMVEIVSGLSDGDKIVIGS